MGNSEFIEIFLTHSIPDNMDPKETYTSKNKMWILSIYPINLIFENQIFQTSEGQQNLSEAMALILFTNQVNPKGITYPRLLNLTLRRELIEQVFNLDYVLSIILNQIVVVSKANVDST